MKLSLEVAAVLGAVVTGATLVAIFALMSSCSIEQARYMADAAKVTPGAYTCVAEHTLENFNWCMRGIEKEQRTGVAK